MKSHGEVFRRRIMQAATAVDVELIDDLANRLAERRARGGRVFLIGNGGGAGNASHAAADFRKLAGLNAYAWGDNVSELTARVNDEGWQLSTRDWLDSFTPTENDSLIVFSVGGGDRERVSWNLSVAAAAAHVCHVFVCAVVGAKGTICEYADMTILVDAPEKARTPIVEVFQSVVWHAVATHPVLR